MKKLVHGLLIIISTLFYCSCEAPAIERFDQFNEEEVIEILLDFDFRESNSGSGYVQFSNLSKGFQSYFWDFGFKDKDGKAASSNDARPYVFFPANGEYLIILRGIDVNNKEHHIHRYILIKNMCC